MLDTVILKSVVAGLVASVACGMGAMPLMIRRIDPGRHTGIGYAFAGGLMFAASVYNLILPGLTMNATSVGLAQVGPVLVGLVGGALFLSLVDAYLSPDRFRDEGWSKWGDRTQVIIFLAMMVHSIPEGVAVGVGYASGEVYDTRLGSYIALAIAIHNIPEGLAVAIPMRSAGASIPRCFVAAFLTSLPQPIAAVPASVLSWFFQPLMPYLMGFAAGAMIFLVLLEMIPHALDSERPVVIAWSFIAGFCLMLLVQVIL
jgi:ZIP family zinc transporter